MTTGFEWQTWGETVEPPPPPPPPPTPTLVGVTTNNTWTGTTTLPLPVGWQPGDLFVVQIAHFQFGVSGFPADSRIVAQRNNVNLRAAWGYLDESGLGIKVSSQQDPNRAAAMLAVYRDAEVTGVAHDVATLPRPCTSFPEAVGAIVLSAQHNGGVAGTSTSETGSAHYVKRHAVASASAAGAAHCTLFDWVGDAPNPVATFVSNGTNARSLLVTLQVATSTPDPDPPDPDPAPAWVTDPDRSHALAGLTVTYGRPDAASRCRPLQGTAILGIAAAGDCPPVGERFRLTLPPDVAAALGLDEDEAALFTGEVTDPTIDPGRRTYEIVGTGRLGRANRRTLAGAEWPVEDDGARAGRILTRAGVDVGVVDAGLVDLIPPDGDATAGTLLETVTDSTGGSVVEQPSGLVDYHDADHRRDTPVTLTLAASQLSGRVTWEQHVDDVLNEMEVSWSGGAITARDPASIAERDTFPGRLTTALTTASDAHSLGQLYVSRRSAPVWQLPNLEVDLMRMVDDATRADLLRLRHGDRIKVTGIPGPVHPYAGDVEFFVEGWSMKVDRPHPDLPIRWKLTLSVSDPTLSGVSIRWVDIPAGVAWTDLDVGLSWFDLGRVENPADL